MSNDFKSDIIDLFSYKMGGHVQKYCYGGDARPDGTTGSKLWHDFVTAHEHYYPIRDEIASVPMLLANLGRRYDNIIDFGIGDEAAIRSKMIPILRLQEKLKYFTAIDFSRKSLDDSLGILRREMPEININGIQGDFYHTHKVKGSNRLGLLFGPNISNQDMMVGEKLPYGTIVERLGILASTVRGDASGHLVVSIDKIPDLRKALKAYEHPYWNSMMTGLAYDIQSKLKPEGDFSPSLWHYEPVLDQDNHVVQHTLAPSLDQNFTIDDYEFDIKKGEQFVVLNSFKFPLDLFMGMLEDAELSNNRIIANSNDHPMVFVESAV